MVRPLTRHAAGLLLGFSLMSASAQDGDGPVVKIDGMKNPQMHSYRAVVKGLDIFDKLHHLAPAVPEVRFYFQMRGDQVAPDEAPVLRIAGDELSRYVPIGPDGRFSIPRIQQAIDEDAALIMNRKKNAYRIGPDIRTPGLPADVRRLGDLRLECQVKIAIAKAEAPFWVVAAGNSVLLTRDWCSIFKGDKADYDVEAAAPVSAATMVHGERKRVLKTEKGKVKVPIAEPDWPDDALIELTFGSEG